MCKSREIQSRMKQSKNKRNYKYVDRFKWNIRKWRQKHKRQSKKFFNKIQLQRIHIAHSINYNSVNLFEWNSACSTVCRQRYPKSFGEIPFLIRSSFGCSLGLLLLIFVFRLFLRFVFWINLAIAFGFDCVRTICSV